MRSASYSLSIPACKLRVIFYTVVLIVRNLDDITGKYPFHEYVIVTQARIIIIPVNRFFCRQYPARIREIYPERRLVIQGHTPTLCLIIGAMPIMRGSNTERWRSNIQSSLIRNLTMLSATIWLWLQVNRTYLITLIIEFIHRYAVGHC